MTYIPSDISGVRSSTFQRQTPGAQILSIDSASTSPRGSMRQYEESRHKDEDRNNWGLGTMFLSSGFQKAEMDNIIMAAKNNTGGERGGRFIGEPLHVKFPCSQKTMQAVCLLLCGLFVTVLTIKLLGDTWDFENMDKNASWATAERVLHNLKGVSSQSQGQSLWFNHIVVSERKRILIPQSFESRYNDEIAPIFETRVNRLWDESKSKSPACGPGEHLLVAFSFAKSGSLPAGIAYECPCTPRQSAKRCVQEKRISDLRDLVVTLPSVSSRSTYVIKVGEDRAGDTESSRVPTPRRIVPFGITSGPLQIELSDGSALALQRYCGTDRKNFAEDLDILSVTKDNTRVLTVYELKRLFSLWSPPGSDRRFKLQNAWDRLQLSKLSVNPIDHSRHAFSLHDLKFLLLPPRTLPSEDNSINPQSKIDINSFTQKDDDFPRAKLDGTEFFTDHSSGDNMSIDESSAQPEMGTSLNKPRANLTTGDFIDEKNLQVEDTSAEPAKTPPVSSTISHTQYSHVAQIETGSHVDHHSPLNEKIGDQKNEKNADGPENENLADAEHVDEEAGGLQGNSKGAEDEITAVENRTQGKSSLQQSVAQPAQVFDFQMAQTASSARQPVQPVEDQTAQTVSSISTATLTQGAASQSLDPQLNVGQTDVMSQPPTRVQSASPRYKVNTIPSSFARGSSHLSPTITTQSTMTPPTTIPTISAIVTVQGGLQQQTIEPPSTTTVIQEQSQPSATGMSNSNEMRHQSIPSTQVPQRPLTKFANEVFRRASRTSPHAEEMQLHMHKLSGRKSREGLQGAVQMRGGNEALIDGMARRAWSTGDGLSATQTLQRDSRPAVAIGGDSGGLGGQAERVA